eukprot:TRINITY_DN1568_c1_g1_i1.p1 TRINITY_DN1568_c1_g1~~TRINITY_DN1568_c1_g1_i1.p1  ORF type:complete len:125 (+),score=66.62 TRINITY_DN1568_c1_g1_i1:198-572(+)
MKQVVEEARRKQIEEEEEMKKRQIIEETKKRDEEERARSEKEQEQERESTKSDSAKRIQDIQEKLEREATAKLKKMEGLLTPTNESTQKRNMKPKTTRKTPINSQKQQENEIIRKTQMEEGRYL